ncbi:uncharacterized protein LOC112142763 [Oryzias melastigma]|uniref:uncharacterized protein LOC112142763 n=1 Tax=Oryzias melastigma TaxID=30732 RepID=UPI00168D3CBA|nr:uncharacterized protein LOC112142763 [Oryzias melastigma]
MVSELTVFRRASNGTLLLKASDEARALGPPKETHQAKTPIDSVRLGRRSLSVVEMQTNVGKPAFPASSRPASSSAASEGIIRQLAPTYSCQLSCDQRVIAQLRSRTLGDSTNRLYNTLREHHSDSGMRRAVHYLGVCEQFLALGSREGAVSTTSTYAPSAVTHLAANGVRLRRPDAAGRVQGQDHVHLRVHPEDGLHQEGWPRAPVEIRSLPAISNSRVDQIVALWECHPESDKQRVVYPARHRDRQPKGRFKAAKEKSASCLGKESLQRGLLGLNASPANWPDASRLVEAICSQLCHLQEPGGVLKTRESLVLGDYVAIREVVLGSPRLMAQTGLQLFQLNQRTLSQWFSTRQKIWERAVLEQEVRLLPAAPAVSLQPVLEAKGLSSVQVGQGQPFDYRTPEEKLPLPLMRPAPPAQPLQLGSEAPAPALPPPPPLPPALWERFFLILSNLQFSFKFKNVYTFV